MLTVACADGCMEEGISLAIGWGAIVVARERGMEDMIGIVGAEVEGRTEVTLAGD